MTQIVALCDFWDGTRMVLLGEVLEPSGAETARYLETGYVDAAPGAVEHALRAQAQRSQPSEEIILEAPDD